MARVYTCMICGKRKEYRRGIAPKTCQGECRAELTRRYNKDYYHRKKAEGRTPGVPKAWKERKSYHEPARETYEVTAKCPNCECLHTITENQQHKIMPRVYCDNCKGRRAWATSAYIY